MALVVLAGSFAIGGTKTWKGLSGGNWSDAANWDPAGSPAIDDDVYFAPVGDLTVVIDKDNQNVNSLHFMSGNTAFSGSGKTLYMKEQEAAELEIAGTATFTMTSQLKAYSVPSSTVLRKTGTGTFYMNANLGDSTRYFVSLDIEAGTVIPGAVNALRTNPRVCNGAKLQLGINSAAITGDNAYIAGARLERTVTVEQGGVFDLHGHTVTLNAIVGNGKVVNLNDDGSAAATVAATLKLIGGPHVFGGALEGGSYVGSKFTGPEVVLSPLNVADENARWIVSAGESLAGGRVTVAANTVNALGFASGVGAFTIGVLNFSASTASVKLEDESGAGVSVVANTETSNSSGAFHVTGKGNFYLKTASTIGDRTFVGSAFKGLTGEVGTVGGGMILGSGSASQDVDLSTVSGLVADAEDVSQYAHTCLNWKNTAPAKFTKPVRGNGRFIITQPVEFTQLQIGPDNTKFEIRADVIASGAASKAVVAPSVFMNTVAAPSLTLTNGAWMGGATFAGTRGDNAYTRLPVSGGVAFSVVSPASRSALTIADGATFVLSGYAPMRVNLLSGGCLDLFDSLNMSGIEADNDPQIVTLNGGLLRLRTVKSFSDGINKNSIRQKLVVGANGAFIDIDAETEFASKLMTFSEQPLRGADGGDGGLTRTGGGYLRFAGVCDFQGDFRNLDGVLQYGNTDAVKQGASRVFGYGNLILADCRLEAVNSLATQTFGLGGGAGKHFEYRGAVSIRARVASDKPVQNFVVGPAGAASGASLVRSGKGAALFIQDFKPDAPMDGSDFIVKVNGGVPLAASGATKEPVFAYGTRSAHEHRQVDFMTYDADAGLVRFTGAVEGLAGGAEKIAKVTSEKATVVENDMVTVSGLQIHALNAIGSYSADTAAEVANTNAPLVVCAGATLRIGNGTDPASVILNNNEAGSGFSPAGIKGSGTIDFGSSEGVITASRQNAASRAAFIVPTIAGTGGLTLVGGSDAALVKLLLLGDNTYSGGTRISSLRVEVRHGGCFGTGDVYVTGGDVLGGQLAFTTAATHPGEAVLTNRLHVSGKGVSPESGIGQEWGALWFTKPTRLSGDVEIVGETRVTAGAGPTTAIDGAGTGSYGRFDGVVSGGRLQVWRGPAEIVLSRPNTYTGGTEVVGGVLTLEGVGTAGFGEIVLDGGTLRLKNTVPLTIPKLSGVGTVVYEGTAAVTIVDRSAYAGAFRGQLSGDVDYVKTDAGTDYLSKPMTQTGKTVIGAGKVVLNEPTPAAALPVADAALHLDASVASTVTVTDGTVASWADVDGHGIVFADTKESGYGAPTYETAAVNGLSAIRASTRFRLKTTAMVKPVTTFVVVRPDATVDSEAHVFGPLNGGTSAAFVFAGMDVDGKCLWNNFGELFVNGESGRSFVRGETVVHTRRAPYECRNFANATLGDFTGWRRLYRGYLCEIVSYERVLEDDERQEVESYLMNKWGVKTTGQAKLTDILPTSADVTVAANATLDLAGSDQTLSGFDCAGEITNTTTRKSTLTLTGDASFAADASFGGKIVLVLGPGATLDLGGGTFTIYRLINNGGTVVNGTLNETNPKRGFLLLVK